jgi:esterase/lipase superfamily enzyme
MGPRGHIATVIAVGVALACGACSTTSQGTLTPVAAAAEGSTPIQILAVTNRKRSTTDAGEMFTGERSDETSYASVTVAAPPGSAPSGGGIQIPGLTGTTPRNFVTVGADHLDKRAFSAAISTVAKQSGRNKVLIFVHGFNNRFDDAVYRFAQVVHDSGAEGIPVLFTWPSRGELRLNAYAYDRESAIYSRDTLEQLLDTLAANRDVKEVNILAHSMGNWVTLEALRSRAIGGGKAGIGHKVKNVFLVAPDVDVDVFRTQIRRMGNARPRFALFVSQDDKALSVAKFIWGGMPRIGDINPEQEPYRDALAQEHITVFDLTKLPGNNAHTRAFDDITQVIVMVREQLDSEPVVTQGGRVAGGRASEPVVTSGGRVDRKRAAEPVVTQGGRVDGKRVNDRTGPRAALTTAE